MLPEFLNFTHSIKVPATTLFDVTESYPVWNYHCQMYFRLSKTEYQVYLGFSTFKLFCLNTKYSILFSLKPRLKCAATLHKEIEYSPLRPHLFLTWYIWQKSHPETILQIYDISPVIRLSYVSKSPELEYLVLHYNVSSYNMWIEDQIFKFYHSYHGNISILVV